MQTSRPIGIAPLTVLELTPPEIVSCAAGAGFDCLGLRLIAATPDGPHHDMVGDTDLVRETRRRLDDTGLRVTDVEVFRLQPDTRVDDYRAALETGARLGASHALAVGQDPDWARLIERFGRFCDLAAECGLTADIEPMRWVEVRDVATAGRLIAAAGRPNAGIVVDALHFYRADSVPAEIAALPPAWFRYWQLCDAPARAPTDLPGFLHEARAERLMPGDGGLDLAALARALPRSVPVSLEIPMAGLAREEPARERVRRMLDRTRRFFAGLG